MLLLPVADLAPLLPPATTALVVVDAQVDFAAPHGRLGRAGVDLSAIAPALARAEGLVAAARAAGVAVAFLRVVTRPQSDSPALQALMARRGMAGGEAICRADDGGADFYRLAPRSGDITVEKPLFDGFHATDLDAQLRARGIETLVLAGFSTDCCVAATAGSGFHRGYHIFVAGDACATYEAQWQEAALAQMARHCALVVATGAIVAAWA
ncbi:MAG TPA: cysteine hydrolase [Novosphingobium sp.]|nr:cysteine hydrolase [Novosphingobium sp.]HZV10347.1 cysteine hydrolase [Novosphingobium sp.]